MSELLFKKLTDAPLLSGVAVDQIRKISEEGQAKVMKGRFDRIDADELTQRLFFVLSGEMRMFRALPDGQVQLIQRFRAGEFFCLSALVSNHGCNNYVVNSGTVETHYWTHKHFRAFMRDNPDFYGNVLAQLGLQIEQERELRSLSHCCRADVKVAAYLMFTLGKNRGSGNNKIDLRPIGLTAQELGVARETLSRSLQRLARYEGISYQRGWIKINDPSALEHVLENMECSCQLKIGA